VAASSASRAGAAFQQALALHRQSRLEEARIQCQKALRLQPRHFKALHLLGAIALQSNDPARALGFLGSALQIDPQSASAHNDHGNALSRLRHSAAAIASYDKAISLKPDFADAYYNRGNEQLSLRELAAAVSSYDLAIAHKSDHAEAYNNRGNALLGLGRYEAAIESYERAIALKSAYADAWYNRGIALQALGRPESAITSHERAIALRPDYATAFNQRGKAYDALGRYEAAIESYDEAIALKTDYVEALYNRGVALSALKRYEAAISSYERAIALHAEHAVAYNNRGAALFELKQYEAALASYERALALKPDYAGAHYNRGHLLHELSRFDAAIESYERAIALSAEYAEAHYARGVALARRGRHEAALASFDVALALKPEMPLLYGMRLLSRTQLCDWGDLDADVARLATLIERGEPASGPFAVLSVADSPALQLRSAQLLVRERFALNDALGPIPKYPREERIRIGYFSADLHNHATLHLMAGLFEMHDRSRFECTAFSFGVPVQDGMRERAQAALEHFVDVRDRSDQQVAMMARELRIDIAVDLKGFTDGNRTGIFALRAAPLQVSYLGYPGTMGAQYIDYLIADRSLIPESAQRHYSEQIIYLPDSYQVNDDRRVIADDSLTREQCGLPPVGFVYCCFNSPYKILPGTFESWMRILSRVPGSVLWLLADNAAAERNLRREALERGVDPGRLVFAPRLPLAEHLARHRLADLFLDTFPCNAHTTASDALWAGLPVLTRSGEGFAARVASSLLSAVALPELSASTPAQYEESAVALAQDFRTLTEIRQRLAAGLRTAPLFDTRLTTRYLEAAYVQMYERYQADLAPEDMDVRGGCVGGGA
jgi:protein O-GlcNAc transferase